MADNLKGKDFVLLAARDGNMIPICCGRELSLSVTADTIEATKAPQSNWKSYIYGDLGYSLSSSGLIILDSSYTINDFYSIITNREILAFVAYNEQEGNLFFSGNILLTSIEVSGSYKDMMTYSISAIGDGPLNTTNPYVITMMTDGDGNPIEDGEGNIIYDQESGDLLPIDLSINC